MNRFKIKQMKQDAIDNVLSKEDFIKKWGIEYIDIWHDVLYDLEHKPFEDVYNAILQESREAFNEQI